MGLGSPKTKAECDRAIASKLSVIAHVKATLASMPNGKPYSAEWCNKNQMRHTLENHKADLARLKELKKTLK